MMKSELSKLKRQRTKNIAVVGNGVIALTTAHVLLARGYHVKLYVNDIAQSVPKDLSNGLIDSSLCVKMGESQEAQMRFELAKLRSYSIFKKLAQSQEQALKGIATIPCYVFGVAHDVLQRNLAGMCDDIKPVHVKCENGIERDGFLYNALIVDPVMYINTLVNHLTDMNVIMRQRTVDSRENVMAIPEKVVFNCMDLNARTVFNDQDMVPMSGQIVRVNQNEPLPYAICDQSRINENGMFMTYVPCHQGALIGGVIHGVESKAAPDHQLTEMIIKNIREWFGLPIEMQSPAA
jgi:D-amino-acid oxidase